MGDDGMKWQLIGLLGAALLMGGCKHRQKPPQTTQPVQVTKTAMPAGFIGQCGHTGARNASIAYPAGWQARLNRTVPEPGPATVTDELLGGEELPPMVVIARNDQPVSPARPTYPDTAASGKIESVCEMLFDVGLDGSPQNVLVACSNRAFVGEARTAVSALTFSPKREDGRDVIRWNVQYPIQFCMADPRMSGS